MLRHPQRDGSPAASQFQDVLAVGQIGAFAGDPEHPLLRGVEGLHSLVPIPAAVFEPGPQAQLIEAGGNLVVLLVGRAGLDRDRAGAQAIDEGLEFRVLTFLRGFAFFAKSLSEQISDADPDEPVGQEVSGEEGVDEFHGCVFLNQGTKALVVL